MTSFKRYALYHAKSTLLRGAVTAAICLLLCLTFLDVTVIQENGVNTWAYISLSILPVMLAVLAFAMPLLELEGFRNRRNLDTLFSMPVSRTKMAAVHFLNGLLQITVIYSLCFACGIMRMLPAGSLLRTEMLLPYYVLTLLGGFIIYAVFCFILVQAETTADGVVLLMLYTFTPFVMLSALNMAVFREDVLYKAMNHSFLFSPLADMASRYERMIENVHATLTLPAETVGMYIFWLVLGVAAVVGFFLTFARHRTEGVEGTSETWFGYRVLIPLLGMLVAAMAGAEFILLVLTLIAMTVLYIIYRRSVRLRRSDLIMLAVTTGVFLLSGLMG